MYVSFDGMFVLVNNIFMCEVQTDSYHLSLEISFDPNVQNELHPF